VTLIALATPSNRSTEHLAEYQAQRWHAIAHQVELAEDVGATLHIEPNDTPRAGEKVLAWFALTKKGGKTIPLSDCSCQIEIFARSDSENPIVTPTPRPVNSEGYQNIPGAEFTFPNVGAYTLVISGEPKSGGAFQPFELAFDVTVAAGTSTNAQPESEPESALSESAPAESELAESENGVNVIEVEEVVGESGLSAVGVIAGVVGVGVVGAIALNYKKRS